LKADRRIRARKTVVDAGSWQQGRISATAFPLSRSPIKLGKAWRWRVVRLASGGNSYRLLVAYRSDKPDLWAWLAQEHAKGLAVLCCLEDHAKPYETGIHCHAPCEDDPEIPLGAQRYRAMIRLPGYGKHHRRRAEFTDMSVLPMVLRFFGVRDEPL
jgi:hypothetical protein